MLRKGVTEVVIKQGEPMCYVVPYRREEYDLIKNILYFWTSSKNITLSTERIKIEVKYKEDEDDSPYNEGIQPTIETIQQLWRSAY